MEFHYIHLAHAFFTILASYLDTLSQCRNKGGICIPNSMTEVWTVVDVDLLIDISIQLIPMCRSGN